MSQILYRVENDCLGISSTPSQRIHGDVIDAAERIMNRLYHNIRTIEPPKYIGMNTSAYTPIPQSIHPGKYNSQQNPTKTNREILGTIYGEEVAEHWEACAQAWLDTINIDTDRETRSTVSSPSTNWNPLSLVSPRSQRNRSTNPESVTKLSEQGPLSFTIRSDEASSSLPEPLNLGEDSTNMNNDDEAEDHANTSNNSMILNSPLPSLNHPMLSSSSSPGMSNWGMSSSLSSPSFVNMLTPNENRRRPPEEEGNDDDDDGLDDMEVGFSP